MKSLHSFHIPVMGIAFTVDTPIKVAHYGIDSVMTIGEDKLDEKLRKVYCEQYNIPYKEITESENDYRAKRITAYLDLINELAEKKFNAFITSPSAHKSDIERYVRMLPESSKKKQNYFELTSTSFNPDEVSEWVKNNLQIGSIDGNIMTKLDKENYHNGEKLPSEHNDAHVALRGYANSTLNSSIILSAGLNPRLFAYMENFSDFFPDAIGNIKKKIVLKVSDYRSALIQGKFLAKRGLWVSEYRIESGLNCGGHAFATEGYLLGPILEEFKNKRNELIDEVYEIIEPALINKSIHTSKTELPFRITAQGGVGTHEEHEFLIRQYGLDSVGWGTPFLLVPEVTNVDEITLGKLVDAKEDDLELSTVSPLGVLFNNLRNSTKEIEQKERIASGKPGSPCVAGHLKLFNKEFSEEPICLASRRYQKAKIKELKKENLLPEEHKKRYDRIVDKLCLCSGLVNPALFVNNLKSYTLSDKVAICPGPNLAYFSKIMTLDEITNHIYGRANVISRTDRPNFLIKELDAYIKFLTNEIENARESMTNKERQRLLKFAENLEKGIAYYNTLFQKLEDVFASTKYTLLKELEIGKERVNRLAIEVENILLITS